MSILISEQYPNKYLKADDIPKPVIWSVDYVELADMPGGDTKPVIFFKGQEKGLVANKTNSTALAIVYGDDTGKWKGKKVELFTMPVTFNGQTKPAIRVKTPADFDDDIPA